MGSAMHHALTMEADADGLLRFDAKGQPDTFDGMAVEISGTGDGFVLLPE